MHTTDLSAHVIYSSRITIVSNGKFTPLWGGGCYFFEENGTM
jgi:hypothetical protein